MAGNFWQSSHYQQWLLDKQELVTERHPSVMQLEEDDFRKVYIFFANFIQALGEQLKVRQQVIATATIYFKRFYCKNSMKCVDPLLMAPTCIFLAAKVEESGLITNTKLISTCQQLVKNKYMHAYPQEFPYRIQNVLECEFYLMEMMDCCLILYHPYRPLTKYAVDIGLDEQIFPLSWRIVNDSLRTDIPLLYPPFMVALAALYMACIIQERDVRQWFADLAMDMDKIYEITRQIVSLYELWKSYDEKKEICSLLAKMPKPKLSPSRPPSQGPNGQDNSADGSHTQTTHSSQSGHSQQQA